jgi:hypothetical protein
MQTQRRSRLTPSQKKIARNHNHRIRLYSASIFLGMSCLCASSAHAQFTSGTTIVFSVSQQKLVVAADSRDLADGSDRTDVRDDACKILAIGKNLLFTGAGLVAERHTRLTSLNWNAFEEVVRAFSKYEKSGSTHTSQDAVDGAAARWMIAAEQEYSQMQRRDVRGFLSSTTNDTVVDATFIGQDSSGKIKVREVSVTFDRNRARKGGYGPISARNQLWEIPQQAVLKAAGHAEIAYEFSGQLSDRARREAQKWEAEILRRPREDRDVLNVIHLVRLSELYAPKEWGVGGEIDVLEITPTNGGHWIRRKPECPERGIRKMR